MIFCCAFRPHICCSWLCAVQDPEAFVSAMSSMFAKLDPAHIRKHTNVVFQDMIETLRQHQVTLKSTVSTIVVRLGLGEPQEGRV